MDKPKSWTVNYTANRKVTQHQHRNVSIRITEDEVRKLLALEPSDRFDMVRSQDLEDALEEIAGERGHYEEGAWENRGDADHKELDPIDFEITETP